jgi:hypothetical protein
MSVFLNLAGILWCILGAGVLATAKSAIHEILACLAVSFGLMFWGFASVIEQLKAMQKRPEQVTTMALPNIVNQAPPPMPRRAM